jgi:hypothetical protein
MRRWLCVVLLALVTSASTYKDVFACGDKFLRVGRSARFRGYASIHPSSVLVYAPRWTHLGITQFEQMLKHGGHTPVTVTTSSAMSQALAVGKYDVVVTSYADAALVGKELDALPSRPALLPLLYKATKSEATEANARYRCLLRPEKMTPFEALEEIDKLVDLRLKELVPTPAR